MALPPVPELLSERYTVMQRRFAEEFVKDRNGAAAARRAGCQAKNPSGYATKMLRHTNVQRLIAREEKLISQRNKVDQDRIFQEFCKIGLADVTEVFEKIEAFKDGKKIDELTIADLKGLPADLRAAIESVEMVDGKIKIKMHSKISALRNAGEMIGAFNQHSLGVNVTNTLDDILKKADGGTKTIEDLQERPHNDAPEEAKGINMPTLGLFK